MAFWRHCQTWATNALVPKTSPLLSRTTSIANRGRSAGSVIQAAVLLAGYSRRPKRFTSAARQMAAVAASLAVIADALFRRDGGNTRFVRSKA